MITIDEAIARVPVWKGKRATSVVPLAGGITNLNYQVEFGGDTFVVSIAGAHTETLGIDRGRAYTCTQVAGRTGVGPDVLCALPADGILVTRFIAGRRLTADDVAHPETLARIVRSFHRYHAGPEFPGTFSPFETLRAYLRTARARETTPSAGAAQAARARLPSDIGPLYERVAAIEEAVRRGRQITRPCHNDLWEFNLIDDGAVIRVIDWEYAGTGDLHFDLANFAMHHRFGDALDEMLLRAYHGEVSGSGVARLKLLKIIAELREAMWAIAAQDLPATAAARFDCTGYARTHFDRCRRATADPRVSEWLRMLTSS